MKNDSLVNKLNKSDIVKSVELLSNGNLRIQTAFQYSDGAYVDVFIENFENVNLDKEFILSDFGTTIQWLESAKIETDSTLELLNDRLKKHNSVFFKEDELCTKVVNSMLIIDSVISLCQFSVATIDIAIYYHNVDDTNSLLLRLLKKSTIIINTNNDLLNNNNDDLNKLNSFGFIRIYIDNNLKDNLYLREFKKLGEYIKEEQN